MRSHISCENAMPESKEFNGNIFSLVPVARLKLDVNGAAAAAAAKCREVVRGCAPFSTHALLPEQDGRGPEVQ